MIRCTVGVFAHNEAHNVGRALHALLAQRVRNVEIVEIVVVASGCTDRTVELAQQVASAHPIVTVDVEEHRRGKAAAMRRLMAKAQGDVIVFVGADTLPAPSALEHLLEPFADPTVGMTGARVIPLNAPTTFLGFAVQMLWYVHHHLALRKPKLGELVACRNVIADFPDDTSTDDLALEALITRQGYRLVYAPKAVVYNRGPEVFDDFVVQRRRIFAGEIRIALRYGYFASSLSARHVVPLAVEAIRTYPQFIVWTCGAMGLELWARLLGTLDAVRGRESVVWRQAGSTKVVAGTTDPVTLVSVRWPPDAVDGAALLTELRSMPESVSSVFWWDRKRGEVLLKLAVSDAPAAWVQTRLHAITAEHAPSSSPSDSSRISWRLVQFAPTSSPPAT